MMVPHSGQQLMCVSGAMWTYEPTVNRCYMFEEPQSMTWQQARDYCRGLGDGIYLVTNKYTINTFFQWGRPFYVYPKRPKWPPRLRTKRSRPCSHPTLTMAFFGSVLTILMSMADMYVNVGYWFVYVYSKLCPSAGLGIFRQRDPVLWLGQQSTRGRRQELYSHVWQRRLPMVWFVVWQHVVAFMWGSSSYQRPRQGLDTKVNKKCLHPSFVLLTHRHSILFHFTWKNLWKLSVLTEMHAVGEWYFFDFSFFLSSSEVTWVEGIVHMSHPDQGTGKTRDSNIESHTTNPVEKADLAWLPILRAELCIHAWHC